MVPEVMSVAVIAASLAVVMTTVLVGAARMRNGELGEEYEAEEDPFPHCNLQEFEVAVWTSSLETPSG
jgi:hypothetical protein